LDVTSLTSVMRFKATKQSIPEIGRTLGVDAIVESSVQRAGNRVRIIAHLIRASTDTHLWAKEFNGSTSDLLELQSDVARDWEWERAEQAYRKAIEINPDSHEMSYCYAVLLSILGRHAESVALMQHSAKVNPLLSASYANLGGRLYEARRYPEAMVALRRALEMEPENFQAHFYLAHVCLAIGRPEDTVREFDRPPFTGTSIMAYAHADIDGKPPDSSV
jgi:tetratricopeptide (TPR) repeat protein